MNTPHSPKAQRSAHSPSEHYLTTYPGYRKFSFGETTEALAFQETRDAWVAAHAPLVDSARQMDAWKAFHSEARAQGRQAAGLPVDSRFAARARSQGFHAVRIGVEAIFEKAPIEGGPTHESQKLFRQGAQIECLTWSELSEEKRAECDRLLQRWLAGRWMRPLGFLNRVAPWENPEKKRFFLLRFQGRLEAFIAAVPVPAAQAWYLVDIIRSPEAPHGAQTLLVSQALRHFLIEEKAQWCTLGLSPLAQTTDTFQWLFRNGNLPYRFNSLHAFKLRFAPTRLEARYGVFSCEKPVQSVLGALQALLPGGTPQLLEGITRGILHPPGGWARIWEKVRAPDLHWPKWGEWNRKAALKNVLGVLFLGALPSAAAWAQFETRPGAISPAWALAVGSLPGLAAAALGMGLRLIHPKHRLEATLLFGSVLGLACLTWSPAPLEQGFVMLAVGVITFRSAETRLKVR
jgi:hypothetical protein